MYMYTYVRHITKLGLVGCVKKSLFDQQSYFCLSLVGLCPEISRGGKLFSNNCKLHENIHAAFYWSGHATLQDYNIIINSLGARQEYN